MQKVSFSLVGAQKCGTTGLATFLNMHPSIALTRKQEAHYFDNENYFAGSRPDYTVYHNMYDETDKQCIFGDVSPSYMYLPGIAKRMWEYNPAFKLIVLLRNPIHRAHSQWNMQRERGIEKRTFYDAIINEGKTLRENLPDDYKKFAYVDRGFYSEQLRRLFKYFPTEQVQFYKQEELLEQHDVTLRSIFEYLDVDSELVFPQMIVHKREYEESIDTASKEYLLGLYEYEIRQLERMLEWNCDSWFI